MGSSSARIDLEIRDKKGIENQVADHLSRISNDEVGVIQPDVSETFPDEQLLAVTGAKSENLAPWYANIVNFLVSKVIPPELNSQNKGTS